MYEGTEMPPVKRSLRLTAALLLAPAFALGAAEATLHKNLAWQITLERVGLSPGLIDGIIGPKTRMATAEFQRVRGLPQTGQLDARTAALLKPEPASAITSYTVQAADLQQVGPVPRRWVAKSKLGRLKYESLHAMLAEKFHCSKRLLSRLNRGTSFAALRPGSTIRVPTVPTPEVLSGSRLAINLADKVIRVLDGQKRMVALFHCSIARSRSDAPKTDATVKVIVHGPEYTFDPKKWPEVKGVTRVLRIPPGPRNPVGLCWIGLSLPGYGIHGSPAPELIGKTGSHGCFRMTNWDALRLAKMIRVGTPVTFTTKRERKW